MYICSTKLIITEFKVLILILVLSSLTSITVCYDSRPKKKKKMCVQMFSCIIKFFHSTYLNQKSCYLIHLQRGLSETSHNPGVISHMYRLWQLLMSTTCLSVLLTGKMVANSVGGFPQTLKKKVWLSVLLVGLLSIKSVEGIPHSPY